MYEVIIIIRILMQFLQPKSHTRSNDIMFYYIPSPPPTWTRLMYYVNNNMHYVKSIAEHIKASLPVWNQSARIIRPKREIPMNAQTN